MDFQIIVSLFLFFPCLRSFISIFVHSEAKSLHGGKLSYSTFPLFYKLYHHYTPDRESFRMLNKHLQKIAILSTAFVLMACNESSRIQPAAMALSKHAVVNGIADTNPRHKAVAGLYITAGVGRYSSCDYSNDLICTGTLIHPKYVLTAAHCVTNTSLSGTVSPSSCNKQLKIGFGDTESELSKHLYAIDTITYHPNYGDYAKDSNYETINADIAVIKLKEEVPPSVAMPIKTLPPKYGITRDDLVRGIVMNFTGFGYSHKGTSGKKLQMDFPVTNYCGGSDDSSGCEAGSVTVNGCHPAPSYCYYYGYQHNVTEYVLIPWGAIYYPQFDGGPCQGDSGGPAFYTVNGEEYLAGITSYGDAICAVYGISTATQDYYDWIVSLAPEVAELNSEHCANGIDDNGDGLADCNDPLCEHIFNCVREICDIGIDDTFDGLSDCDDPQCSDFSQCLPEDCTNGVDDNADGLIDCNDPQCAEQFVCSPEVCDNGIDDNGDGRIDCNDPQCEEVPRCLPEDCTNKIDDNNNGRIDCDDAQCADEKVCQPEICNNGIDDNLDGLTDTEDPVCEPAEDVPNDDATNAASGGCSALRHSSPPTGFIPVFLLFLAFARLRRQKQ